MLRYYDPQIGRFISPDTQDYLAPETIGGVDLYAYGLNNPVMYVDPTGHFALWISLLIGVGVNLAVEFINDLSEDGQLFEDGGKRYLIAGVTGLVSGLVGGYAQGFGKVAEFAINTLASGVIDVLSEAWRGNISDFSDAAGTFFKSVASSILSYGISSGFRYAGAKTKLDKILGNRNSPNIKINARLKNAGYGQFKIGRDGYDMILSAIFDEDHFGNIAEITSSIYSFIYGVAQI